jgi:hypothetical protein
VEYVHDICRAFVGNSDMWKNSMLVLRRGRRVDLQGDTSVLEEHAVFICWTEGSVYL